jgi:hypothetical protein
MSNNLEYFRSRIDSVKDDLNNASETMAELATSLLREAIEGEADAIHLEKSLQKARRSIAKAIQLLENQNSDYVNE